MTEHMTAYIIDSETGPSGLITQSRPRPEVPAGHALVRVRAASLNYRDHLILSGQYGAGHNARGRVPLSDGAGEVVGVGSGVTRLKAGHRIAANFFPRWIDGPANAEKLAVALGGAAADGMLAQYALVPAESAALIPAHLSFEEAATLPCAALTAWWALFETSRVQPGDTVVIQGTGGVSVFALQFAKLAGARAIVTSSSDDKLARATALGADAVINYRSTPDWDKAVLEITGGQGADVVVEVGGPDTLPRAIRAVRVGGTIPVIGILSGVEAPISLGHVLFKHVQLKGVYVGSRAAFDRMNTAIEAAALRPVIDRVFEFGDAAAAFRHLASQQHLGKVVIRVD